MLVRTTLILLFATGAIGLGGLGTAAAQPPGPPAGYELQPEQTKRSPDGTVAIEQYVNKATDEWKWQFWARRQDAFTQLGPAQDDYSANFVFTGDLKWIVRVQKLGSGTSTLYLYRLGPQGFVAATRKPLGELAWAYMKTRPDWRKIRKPPEYHDNAFLERGLEDSYSALGADWPVNRYLVISLSGDADVKGRKPMQTSVVHGWRCRYDLQTGKFDVPPAFAAGNAKAVVPDWPGGS